MLKIIQITDCHLFSDINKLGYNGINPFNSLKHVLQQVQRAKPDRVIVTGDISGDGSEQSYQHFIALLKQHSLTDILLAIPGNHDEPSFMQKHFPAKSLCLDSPHFALDNNWHLHLLDTQTTQSSTGHLSLASLDALERYLSRNASDYHLIAAHHHPIPCDGWMDKHEWHNRLAFTSKVASHSAVKGVIYGHIHMDTEYQQDDCLYMACPSTCWQFANQKTFEVSVLKPGYRVLNLTRNGQIKTSVQRLME